MPCINKVQRAGKWLTVLTLHAVVASLWLQLEQSKAVQILVPLWERQSVTGRSITSRRRSFCVILFYQIICTKEATGGCDPRPSREKVLFILQVAPQRPTVVNCSFTGPSPVSGFLGHYLDNRKLDSHKGQI